MEKMAEERGESVNTVVGKALRKLVEWDRLAESAGMVAISSITLGRLMDSQTPEEAKALGESVANDVWRPIIISRYGEVSLDSILKSIELIGRNTGRFDFIYSTEGSKRVITVRHSGGIKWSMFYLGAATQLFSEVVGSGLSPTMTEELLSIEFEVPESKMKGD